MATRICYPLNKIAEKNIEKVKVPSGMTLYAGDVVLAETLESGSREVYTGAQVSDITAEEPCIVLTQGVYEDSGNYRPGGHPNVGENSFTEGDVITVVRLEEDLKFEITWDALDNTGTVTPAAGVFLTPKNADNQLQTAASAGTALSVLKIEAISNIGMGGQMAGDYEDSVIARVVIGK